MGFLIAYIIGVAIFATGYIRILPEGKSLLTSVLIGLLFPLEVSAFLLSFVYRLFGIDINLTFSTLLSEKEKKAMTDAFMKDFSDELAKMEENIRENDEK